MTVTLELEDEIARWLMSRPDPAQIAADLLRPAAQKDAVVPLLPFREYASEADYIAAAGENAQRAGMDADLARSLAKGVADLEMGRDMSLEEAWAKLAAHKASRRARENAAQGAAE